MGNVTNICKESCYSSNQEQNYDCILRNKGGRIINTTLQECVYTVRNTITIDL